MGRNLGVVAAMPQEIAPLLRRAKGYRRERSAGLNLYRFTLHGAPVLLVESGMGPAHARSATEALIRLGAPRLILNFGFAGAVLPGSPVGELLLAERVLFLEQGRLTRGAQPDPGLTARVLHASASLGVKCGTFITAGRIMNKGEVAGSLRGELERPVLEMETASVLEAAGRAGIPVVAVRCVSDAADEELGFSIEEFCDRELRISPGRVLRCVAGKPWIIPQLLRLSRNSRQAGRNLALCVELALEALAGA